MTASTTSTFAARLVQWQRRSGRHDLPWQGTRDAYRIWLSEIMLQQTQVATVIGYYQRFVARFPDVRALASGSEDEVLRLWAGLGYYSRARNLHCAARIVMDVHGGTFPRAFDSILALPGIGQSTACAIAAFAYGETRAILDGNVKRVLCRHLGVSGFPGDARVAAQLWQHAQALLPSQDIEVYTQGLMDLGATLCTRAKPRCDDCPLSADCVARIEHRVDELPHRRAKKSYPEKTTRMLLLLHGGEVLLEKRPAIGIWGGLWSFPEVPLEADVMQFCRERYAVEVDVLPSWPVLSHAFTHFRLHITAQPLRVVRRGITAETEGRVWLTARDAVGAAIPKPVKTLLQRLEEFAA